MTLATVLSGGEHSSLIGVLREALSEESPRAIGVASAFVSTQGVDLLHAMLPRHRLQGVRLIAGTSLAFTHPNALTMATEKEWSVRLGVGSQGIFHPKVIIGGEGFASDGSITNPSIMYIGSANLTRPALDRNVECGVLFRGECIPADGPSVFRTIWDTSSELTEEALRQYSALFTRRNRTRTSRDLQEFGVTDAEGEEAVTLTTIRQHARPEYRALDHEVADTVWVGLETSTGGYTFQPEFPRLVGDMVLRMVEEDGVQAVSHGQGRRERLVAEIDVMCADGQVRQMTFTYYSHNAMSRLNIPNDVPNAEWAREHRAGIAKVSRHDEDDANIRLEILRPGAATDECVRRSFVLGTWQTTPTRAYGWF